MKIEDTYLYTELEKNHTRFFQGLSEISTFVTGSF